MRLRTEAFKRAAPLEFRKRGRTRTWDLRVPRPDGLARLEYELEVERTNGTTETVVDPENPLRASAPFGERSVLELDGYERPVWLDDDEAPAGTIEPLSIRSRAPAMRTSAAPSGRRTASRPDALLPLLVVHDGPEYAEHSSLLRMFDSAVAELELKPVPRRAARSAGRPQRDVLRVDALRERARLGGRPRAPASSPRRPTSPEPASGWARASERSPPSTRTASIGTSSAASFCSPAASSAGRPTRRSRASRASSGSRASSAACFVPTRHRRRSRS